MNFEDYIRGRRKGQGAHQMERDSMLDAFLADAIDGYDTMSGNHGRHIAAIKRKVAQKHKRRSVPVWVGIAASLLLLFGVGVHLLFFKSNVRLAQSMSSADRAVENVVVELREEAECQEEEPFPKPAMGWKAYREYLREEVCPPSDSQCAMFHGVVVVTFRVGEDGLPVDLKVEAPSCPSVKAEALRVVREGGPWIGKSLERIKVEVLFE